MFLQLATDISPGIGGANSALTTYRPSQLSEYLEACWSLNRAPVRNLALGVPAVMAPAHQGMGRPGSEILDPLDAPSFDPPLPTSLVSWPHLVYAYMIENTRIVDIMQRVVFEWLHGERLPNPSLATQRWLQVTEQLIFAPSW